MIHATVVGVNIVLIGMRGVGKTNIARRVCFLTKRPVMSTDVLVEYEVGLPIPQFVEQQGWVAFREAEYQVLRKLGAMDGLIIDAGGGIVVDLDDDGREVFSDRKVDLLKANGRIVFLAGDIERLAAKVAGDPRRPTLDTRRSTVDLMRSRLPFYERAADWTIDVEGRPRAEIADDIAARYT
jgi:shikimate kinase